MNTKQVGEISEAVFIATALRCGFSVSKPFGDNQPYDLIVDNGEQLVKVQTKTARLVNGVIVANATRSVGIWKQGGRHREKYGDSIDMFALYCPQLDKCYLVPAKEFDGVEIRLRIEPPKNNQQKNVVYADKYELIVP
jgi:hypothetical protein